MRTFVIFDGGSLTMSREQLVARILHRVFTSEIFSASKRNVPIRLPYVPGALVGLFPRTDWPLLLTDFCHSFLLLLTVEQKCFKSCRFDPKPCIATDF